MRKKLLSLLVLLMTAVTGAWADITITWGAAEFSSLTDDQLLAGATKTVNGITVTVNAGSNNFLAVSPVGTMFSATNDNAFTFSTELGNFTKIECTSLSLSGTLGDGWDGATWTGDANSVNMSKAGSFLAVSSITFTIGEPAAPAGYAVSLKAETADEGNWTAKAGEGEYQSLPLEGVAANTAVSVKYNGTKKVKSVKAVKKAPTGTTVDLSTLTGAYEAQDGDVLTGTLPGNYKISIADGATVTLDGVTINGVSSSSYPWAGITCVGDATIILKESSENTVTGFYNRHPGIFIPAGKTLTIKGDGALVARSSGSPAQTPGIGGAYASNGGNIIIEGGTITATGGNGAAGIGGHGRTSFGDITITGGTITASSSGSAAGIGSGGQSGSKSNGRCGNITITGGTITATGGANGAGIGAGQYGECGAISISGGTINATGGSKAAAIGCGGSPSGGGSICGDITIANTVTKVTAIKGSDSPYSIGKGWDDYNKAVCGTVTIGGTIYWDGSAYQNEGDTYLTTSPLVYQPEP